MALIKEIIRALPLLMQDMLKGDSLFIGDIENADNYNIKSHQNKSMKTTCRITNNRNASLNKKLK